MFQDSTEMLIWLLVKKHNLQIKDGATFTANIDALLKNQVQIFEVPRIHELNKARVGFKHYGNLPAAEDAIKYQTTAEVFLRATIATHFQINFDDLSLVDAVPFSDVREHLKKAELLVQQSSFREAVVEASIANGIMLAMLDSYLPEVDSALSGNDRNIEVALGSDRVLRGSSDRGNITGFRYVSDYLSRLRDVTLASLLTLPFNDYFFLSSSLRRSRKTLGGEWVHSAPRKPIEPSAAICARQINCLVNMSIRLDDVLKNDAVT